MLQGSPLEGGEAGKGSTWGGGGQAVLTDKEMLAKAAGAEGGAWTVAGGWGGTQMGPGGKEAEKGLNFRLPGAVVAGEKGQGHPDKWQHGALAQAPTGVSPGLRGSLRQGRLSGGVDETQEISPEDSWGQAWLCT